MKDTWSEEIVIKVIDDSGYWKGSGLDCNGNGDYRFEGINGYQELMLGMKPPYTIWKWSEKYGCLKESSRTKFIQNVIHVLLYNHLQVL